MSNTTYKSTSIGLIPSDWEVKKLEGIALIDNESLKGTTDPEYEFDYISLSDVDSDSFKIETSRQIFKSAPSRARRLVKKGDILMSTVRPNLQGFSIINNDVKDLIASTGFAVITANNADNHFLYQYIFSNSIQKQFYNLIVGSNYPAINSSDVKHLKIPLPPLPEQQKIASILSTWDTAIDNCKEIIEELKIRNKGLAQKLLTGKIRVKGFEKATWSLIPIKKIAKDSSKKNPSDKELVVLSCTKYNGLVPSLEYFGRKIYSDDLTTYKIVSKGQFAYATNHIEEGSIGYQSNYEEALISPMYTVFQTDETVNDNFLFRVLKSTHYIHEYQKRMEGTIDRRGGLRWDEFSKIKVPVPELKEQFAIVDILDKATEELNQYQQKLQTLQLQKKGLMQQLLTGKVRVKTNN